MSQTRASFRLILLGLAICVTGVRPAGATSVIPPTFPELVAEAEAIVRGRVMDISFRRTSTPDGTPVIKTHVTFAVERTLKGPERQEITLELLGGTIGDESLVVTGMPRFELGSTEYLFVERNGFQFCPLVAVRHGRYRLLRDKAGREFVARDNAVPLTDVGEVVLPLAVLPNVVRSASTAGALAPAAFETAISAEVSRTTPAARER